jgi:hypothetical protein
MKKRLQEYQFQVLANQTGVAEEDKPTSYTQVNVDKLMPTSYPLRDKTLTFSISSYNPAQTPFVSDNFWTVHQYQILPSYQLMLLEEERMNAVTSAPNTFVFHKADGNDNDHPIG